MNTRTLPWIAREEPAKPSETSRTIMDRAWSLTLAAIAELRKAQECYPIPSPEWDTLHDTCRQLDDLAERYEPITIHATNI